MYRGRTQTDYQNKHYNINQKDEGTLDGRGRDGGILRIKEQETRLTLQEHDDDDDDNLPKKFAFEEFLVDQLSSAYHLNMHTVGPSYFYVWVFGGVPPYILSLSTR